MPMSGMKEQVSRTARITKDERLVWSSCCRDISGILPLACLEMALAVAQSCASEAFAQSTLGALCAAGTSLSLSLALSLYLSLSISLSLSLSLSVLTLVGMGFRQLKPRSVMVHHGAFRSSF